MSGADKAALREKVDHAYAFLADNLLPHATAEDKALYSVVGRAIGAEMATKTMSRDHVEVGRLTEELGRLRQAIGTGTLDERTKNELRQVLYGLYIVVKLHLTKEEEIYLPLLDEQLDEAGARELFEAMEEAATTVKAVHRH